MCQHKYPPVPEYVKEADVKMIGHHAHLRDVMGQSYQICACTHANHTCYSSVQVIFRGKWKRL